MEIREIVARQRDFFNSNQTKDLNFRIDLLKKLKTVLKENEALLYSAIYDDFHKSEYETYISELSMVYHEINLFLKNIKKWGKRKRVPTGMTNFPAKSYIIPEPLGISLVIGAWNYPYHLSLIPAVTALGAGNTVILKPSELPYRTSEVMAKIINENFQPECFYVFEGGVKETSELLDHPFDKIFFTGSIPVGKKIYQAAAKHLTPVTLELGGKSPTFVLADTKIKMSVKRIVWAKFYNAGQTCVAPDYILVHKSIEKEFLEELKNEIEKYYYKNGDEIAENYVRIINTKNYDRLIGQVDNDRIYLGGKNNREERYISPTVLHNITFEDKIMQDEIFGPILPVISFTDLDEAIRLVKERPKPLACYIYSTSKKAVDKVLKEISFGGGEVNDSLMHLSNSNLPFGGVGLSGIGSYHGKAGFDTFTHYKSIIDKSFWYEPDIKYAPYTANKKKIAKWLME